MVQYSRTPCLSNRHIEDRNLKKGATSPANTQRTGVCRSSGHCALSLILDLEAHHPGQIPRNNNPNLTPRPACTATALSYKAMNNVSVVNAVFAHIRADHWTSSNASSLKDIVPSMMQSLQPDVRRHVTFRSTFSSIILMQKRPWYDVSFFRSFALGYFELTDFETLSNRPL